MNCKKAIELIENELAKAQREKQSSEVYFSELGQRNQLQIFCESLELIEDFETAIKILKNHNKGGQVV